MDSVSKFIEKEPKPKFPNYGVILQARDGWLSPAGRFTTCAPEQHDECAKYLCWINAEEIDKTIHHRVPDLTEVDLESQSARWRLGQSGFLLISHNLPNYGGSSELSRKQISMLMDAGYVLPQEMTEGLLRELPTKQEIIEKINTSHFSDNIHKQLLTETNDFYVKPGIGLHLYDHWDDKKSHEEEAIFMFNILSQGFKDGEKAEDKGIAYARAAIEIHYKLSPEGDAALIFEDLHHAGDSQGENPLVREFRIIFQTLDFAKNRIEWVRNLTKNT